MFKQRLTCLLSAAALGIMLAISGGCCHMHRHNCGDCCCDRKVDCNKSGCPKAPAETPKAEDKK